MHCDYKDCIWVAERKSVFSAIEDLRQQSHEDRTAILREFAGLRSAVKSFMLVTVLAALFVGFVVGVGVEWPQTAQALPAYEAPTVEALK